MTAISCGEVFQKNSMHILQWAPPTIEHHALPSTRLLNGALHNHWVYLNTPCEESFLTRRREKGKWKLWVRRKMAEWTCRLARNRTLSDDRTKSKCRTQLKEGTTTGEWSTAKQNELWAREGVQDAVSEMFHIHTGSHLYVLKPLKVNTCFYPLFLKKFVS